MPAPRNDKEEAIPYRPEADAFDLKPALMRLWEGCVIHSRVVVLVALATIAVVSLYLLVWPKTYTAEVRLLSEAKIDGPREHFYLYWNTFRKDDLASEIELITTRDILVGAIDDLKLTYDDLYHPPLNHLSYLWRQSLVGRAYRSVKEFFIPPKVSPYRYTPEQLEREVLVGDLRQSIVLTPVPDTFVGTLAVKAGSPRVAELANYIADAFVESRRKRFMEEAETAKRALTVEVERTRNELDGLETMKVQYATANELPMEFETSKLDVNAVGTMRASIVELEVQIQGLREKMQALEALLASEPEEVLANRTLRLDDVWLTAKNQLFSLETSLAGARIRFQDSSPEIKFINEQIDSLQTTLKALPKETEFSRAMAANPARQQLHGSYVAAKAEMAAATAALQARRTALNELMTRALVIPQQRKRWHELGRAHSILEQKYNLIKERLMMAEVALTSIRSTPSAVKVVERAMLPDQPSWPKGKLLFLVAVAAGLVGGMIVAVGLDILNPRITRDRLAGVAELPVFAVQTRQGDKLLTQLNHARFDE